MPARKRGTEGTPPVFHRSFYECRHSWIAPLLRWFEGAKEVDHIPALRDKQILIERRHLSINPICNGQEERAIALGLYHRRGQVGRPVGKEGGNRARPFSTFPMAHLTVERVELLTAANGGLVRSNRVFRRAHARDGNRPIDRDRAFGRGKRIFHWAIGWLDLHEGNQVDLDDVIGKEQKDSEENSQYCEDP